MQETLGKYFSENQRTRSFIHAQLLSAHSPEDRQKLLRQWAVGANANATRKLSFMCADRGTSFNASARRLFQDAADLWAELQYIETDIRIISSDKWPFSDWPWGELADLGDIITSSSPSQPSSEEVLILFPGFYAHDKQSELYKGYALWKEQEHVAKANAEWKSFHRTREAKLGPAPSMKLASSAATRRRASISIHGPTPPASPLSSPKQPHTPQA